MRREAGTRRRAASVCGNGAATARIRGWPRGWPRTIRGQHAIVGRWLRRGRCSLVGTDRNQLEVAGHLVRPHEAGVQAAEQYRRDFADQVLIIFSIMYSTAGYSLEYNIVDNRGCLGRRAYRGKFASTARRGRKGRGDLKPSKSRVP